jgi:hypothetical protein
MSGDIRKMIDKVKNFKEFINENYDNQQIKTFGDIRKIINNGKAVQALTYHGNTRTYYLDKNGEPMQQHNKSRPSDFNVDVNNEVSINPLFDYIILD